MELERAVRRRRMTRWFDPRPVPRPTLVELLDLARRAPSAGFSQGVDLVVLDGPDQTSRFWEVTGARGWMTHGELAAPVLVLPMADPAAYTSRYAEPDKVRHGLDDADTWSVPYWLTDAAFAAMVLLLGATDRGLGALFFGVGPREPELLAELAVPPGVRPIGAIALGYPAADDRPSGSPLTRPRRPLDEVVHWGGWGPHA